MDDMDDARVVYDDTRYFSRGRSAYHADPARWTPHEESAVRWTLLGVFALVAIVVVTVAATHFFGPQVAQ